MSAPLVPLTKSASPSESEALYKAARRRRYRAQETAAHVLPGHRVCSCGWRPTEGKQVSISRRGDRHYVSNVVACGSVWACPVCAAKIANQRAEELQRACDAWLARGGNVWMLTLTINHATKDHLDDLLKRFTKAMSQLWAGKWGKKWRDANGQVGMVRNLEVTWGMANGWHPHCHALLFVSKSACPYEAELDIKPHWQRVAARYGFSVSHKRGAWMTPLVDEELSDWLAEYVGKVDSGSDWGFAQELTWANIKNARGERFTPFALLAACDGTNVGAAPLLFQEYADAFKGKRQLYWSKGLRKDLGLTAERSDEELANSKDDESVEVATVPTFLYCAVRARGLLPDLLDAADEGGVDAIRGFLEWAFNYLGLEARERSLSTI